VPPIVTELRYRNGVAGAGYYAGRAERQPMGFQQPLFFWGVRMAGRIFTREDQRYLLRRAGQALFGERWQTGLAGVASVSDRTIRRWIAAPHDIPEDVWREIGHALRLRVAEVKTIQDVIEKDLLRPR